MASGLILGDLVALDVVPRVDSRESIVDLRVEKVECLELSGLG
jgi:hypothetical protein